MRRGGLLLPCESRRLHALRPGGDARPGASAAIAAAPRQGAGRRTERGLSRLPRESVGAAGPGRTGAVLRKAGIIGGALSAQSAYACASAVPGARHGAGAGSVGRAAPRPGCAAGTAGPASAAVSGIAGLREAAALLIGRRR